MIQRDPRIIKPEPLVLERKTFFGLVRNDELSDKRAVIELARREVAGVKMRLSEGVEMKWAGVGRPGGPAPRTADREEDAGGSGQQRHPDSAGLGETQQRN